MNEFGETPTFFVFPENHEEGQPYPDDFYDRLDRALKSEGLSWESA